MASIKVTVAQVAFNLGFRMRGFVNKKTGDVDPKRAVLKMPLDREGGSMRVALLRRLAGITTPVKTGGNNYILTITMAMLEKKVLEVK